MQAAVAHTTSDSIAPQDEALARLLAYWNDKRAGRRFPARRDIDPMEFPYLLGWVMLVDVSYRPLSFRFRLYGSELADHMGLDMTGKDLTEHPDAEFHVRTAREWAAVIDSGNPAWSTFQGWIDERHVRYEVIRLPLSSDGETIDMLLVAIRHLTIQTEAPAPASR